MYTIKVRFNRWGKVYHFASQNTYGLDETVAVVALGEYKEATYLGSERGISPLATKWRTGSSVSQQQRRQYPHKDFKEDKCMNEVVERKVVTEEDILAAFELLTTISRDDRVEHFQPQFNPGYNKSKNEYVIAFKGSAKVETKRGKALLLADLLATDPKKQALQNALDKLLSEAAAIQKEIRGM